LGIFIEDSVFEDVGFASDEGFVVAAGSEDSTGFGNGSSTACDRMVVARGAGTEASKRMRVASAFPWDLNKVTHGSIGHLRI
jgi:hypothetical protein